MRRKVIVVILVIISLFLILKLRNSNFIKNLVTSEQVNYTSYENKGEVLYKDYFKEISLDWTNNGWKKNDDGIFPTINGLNSFMRLNKQYGIDRRSARVTVRFASDSRFMLHSLTQISNSNVATLTEVDVAAGRLRIYKAYNGSSLPAISTEANATILTDRDYIVELLLDKNKFLNRLSITDTVTGETQFVEDITNTAGRQHDSYAMCNYSGQAPVVKSLTVFTPVKKNTFLIVMGDSITEAMGNNATSVDGYAQELVKACGGSGAVSGRGGGGIEGVTERIQSEVQYLKPKYLSIMIGTNIGNTLPKLRKMVELAQSYGCIVILNNVPMRKDIDMTSVNNDIATIRKEYHLSGALMDVATALNNNPSQGYDPAKFYSEGVHPIEFGRTFMFNRFYIDTPEILF